MLLVSEIIILNNNKCTYIYRIEFSISIIAFITYIMLYISCLLFYVNELYPISEKKLDMCL